MPDAPHERPSTLDYSPDPLPFRRRARLRFLIRLLGLFALLAGAYGFNQRILQWWSLVQLRQAILADHDHSDAIVVRVDGTHSIGAFPAPSLWSNVHNTLIASNSHSGPGNLMLVQAICTPSGAKRIVAIYNFPSMSNVTGSTIAITCRLFDPGSFLHPQFQELSVKDPLNQPPYLRLPDGGAMTSLPNIPYGSNFRLFAGRIDPTNSSRFIIPYEFEGKPGHILGTLGDDDSIQLTGPDGSPLPQSFSSMK